MRRVLLQSVLLLNLAACGSTGRAIGDGPPDGGAVIADGGGTADAGGPADGGSTVVDGGGASDAGALVPDAGSVADGGGLSAENCQEITFAELCASCSRQHCNTEVSECFGQSWAERNFSGGKCSQFMECQCRCGNDGACLARCPQPDTMCVLCLSSAKSCQRSQCLLQCGF